MAKKARAKDIVRSYNLRGEFQVVDAHALACPKHKTATLMALAGYLCGSTDAIRSSLDKVIRHSVDRLLLCRPCMRETNLCHIV
jgi:hypothetical protein